MGQHITRYKTENGKTRKVKNSVEKKQAEKNTVPESVSGDNKDTRPIASAKEENKEKK